MYCMKHNFSLFYFGLVNRNFQARPVLDKQLDETYSRKNAVELRVLHFGIS